jgi:hypothetical protein
MDKKGDTEFMLQIEPDLILASGLGLLKGYLPHAYIGNIAYGFRSNLAHDVQGPGGYHR